MKSRWFFANLNVTENKFCFYSERCDETFIEDDHFFNTTSTGIGSPRRRGRQDGPLAIRLGYFGYMYYLSCRRRPFFPRFIGFLRSQTVCIFVEMQNPIFPIRHYLKTDRNAIFFLFSVSLVSMHSYNVVKIFIESPDREV